MAISVIDFFSGCGGTSVGLRAAGMEVVGAIDNDNDSIITFSRNFPGATTLCEDIQLLSLDQLDCLVKDPDLTLFSGCAPCQPFSQQRTFRPDFDPRKLLLLRFVDFIREYLPAFVLVENVPGIQKVSREDDGPFGSFVNILDELGYCIWFDVVNSLDYGVPQRRRRLVLIASRHGQVSLPGKTHAEDLLPFATVRDFIGDLPSLEAGQTDLNDLDHQAAALSEINLERISMTPEGGGMESWPDEYQLKSRKRYKGHTDVYGRLAWDAPASVITTRCTSISNGRFGHPEQNRAISVREAALLQTFPIDFQFSGSFKSRSRQVGNAVPPMLAEVIGRAIIDSLE